MKVIKIFANCNPLCKEDFICVHQSTFCTCSFEEYKEKFLPEFIQKLKSFGLKYRVYEIDKTLIMRYEKK